MSKSVEEILKEMAAFAEKASTAAKADALIKVTPIEALRDAFRAACGVAVELAKGELKPENVPDNAPELAIFVMGVVAAKRMGIDPEELFKRDKESPEKTSGEVGGEAGKPEQSAEEKCKVCEQEPVHTVEGTVHVFTGTHDEIMSKIIDLLKSDN